MTSLRPLREFEQGAHLHVLDWAHTTARYRFQAAGAVQVKVAAKAIAKAGPAACAPPSLPSLEAAIHGELGKLYALGHATVRSELDHQRSGETLPIGLSAAPAPPNLRQATDAKRRCGTCRMFDNGVCWGYGNYGVEPDELCDSWAAETTKTLAVADRHRDTGGLRQRALLSAVDVAHRIWDAVHRGRLQGITDRRTLRQLGREAGNGALAQAASHHAGGAINAGRHAAATAAEVMGARYTSVLDRNTCDACAAADTGQLLALTDPELVHPPNAACAGGDRCRCILVYQLVSARQPAAMPVAAGG
jgi:hypothetical protein